MHALTNIFDQSLTNFEISRTEYEQGIIGEITSPIIKDFSEFPLNKSVNQNR